MANIPFMNIFLSFDVPKAEKEEKEPVKEAPAKEVAA